MDFTALLHRQLDARLADLAGTHVTASVPIGERLINQVLAVGLPPGGTLRQAELHPHAGERLTLRVALAKVSFMPPFNITLEIERQAELPASPVIVLKLTGASGLMGLAGSAAGLARGLPPGMRMEGDRIHVDLREMLRPHGFDWVLALLEELYITTAEGVVTVSFRASVPGA